MSKDGRTWLSHTGIENLKRCPRCFWLQYRKGLRQPEGIVSRLANRFDKVLKNYFDIYRRINELPPIVDGKIPGRLQNPFQETYFVSINDKYGFYGKLDECLVNDKGELMPVDFKTASSDPREREILEAYQAQIDDYIFILKGNRKPVAGDGYLIYFYPSHGEELHKGFPMIVHIVKLQGRPERTAKRIAGAIEKLEEKIPPPNKECEFCRWHDKVTEEINSSLDSDLSIPSK